MANLFGSARNSHHRCELTRGTSKKIDYSVTTHSRNIFEYHCYPEEEYIELSRYPKSEAQYSRVRDRGNELRSRKAESYKFLERRKPELSRKKKWLVRYHSKKRRGFWPRSTTERWQSGRMRRSRKPLCEQSHREFESLPLRTRTLTVNNRERFHFTHFPIVLAKQNSARLIILLRVLLLSQDRRSDHLSSGAQP